MPRSSSSCVLPWSARSACCSHCASERRRDFPSQLADSGSHCRPARHCDPDERREVDPQYRARAAVRGTEVQLFVERQHAGGQVGEQALKIGLGLHQRRVVALGLRACLGELQRHRVEGLGQHANLIARSNRRALAVVAAGHRARAFHEHSERGRKPVGALERERQRREQREQERQGERHAVEPLQAPPRQGEFLVFAISGLHRFRILRQLLRHRLQQLQYPQLVGQAWNRHRDQCAQVEAFIGYRLDRAVALARADLLQRGRTGQLRQQPRSLVAGIGEHPAALAEQGRFLHAGLLAQGVQRPDVLLDRACRERQRHRVSLGNEVIEHAVERAAPEVDPAFERAVDRHLEPRFDRAREELDRHAVDQRARHHRHQCEQQHQAQRQLGAEHAGLELAAQRDELVDDQRGQHQRHRAVQHEQQRVALGERRRVGARGRQQEQHDRDQAHAQDQEVAHDGAGQCGPEMGGCAAHGETVQRCQSEEMVHSREPTALIWNGRGSWEVSRRRRSAAV